jgi:hypothetical protein
MYRRVLQLLGEDPDREGLQATPVRVAKALSFMTSGYNQNPGEIINSAKFKEEYKQMVLVKDIDLYSMCEHHMLPFFGKAHVAYIPNGYITGLSKIARFVEAVVAEDHTLARLTCVNAEHGADGHYELLRYAAETRFERHEIVAEGERARRRWAHVEHDLAVLDMSLGHAYTVTPSVDDEVRGEAIVHHPLVHRPQQIGALLGWRVGYCRSSRS